MHKYNEYLSRNGFYSSRVSFCVRSSSTIELYMFSLYFYFPSFLLVLFFNYSKVFSPLNLMAGWCLWFYISEMPFLALLCPSRGILLKSKSDRTWLFLLFISVHLYVSYMAQCISDSSTLFRAEKFIFFIYLLLSSKMKLEKKWKILKKNI